MSKSWPWDFQIQTGIRSGCVKGQEFGGVIAACLEIVFAFLRFEEVGAGFKESDEAGDGALGQLPQRGLELGDRRFR